MCCDAEWKREIVPDHKVGRFPRYHCMIPLPKKSFSIFSLKLASD